MTYTVDMGLAAVREGAALPSFDTIEFKALIADVRGELADISPRLHRQHPADLSRWEDIKALMDQLQATMIAQRALALMRGSRPH